MQLRDMLYSKIDGTEVAVRVNTAEEAKAAIKELRHKKKEVGLLRRRLATELRRARAHEDKREREDAKSRRKPGFFSALTRLSRSFTGRGRSTDIPRLERDIHHLEEILHNIDSCIIQLEGKLLT